MGRTNTVVGSRSMVSDGLAGATTRHRIPTIVRILSELLHGFMVLFLQRGDLSYSAFCTLWKDEDMPSLHTLCPERIDYAAYIQILYYLLLETQLFLDFSATSRIPSLETIPFQEVRCLVSLVPVLYTLFTLYQTAPATSSIRSIPIRITTSKFQDLALGVRSVVELVDGVGHDVAALWAHLTAGAYPGDPAISASSPAMIPSPSAFEEAAYTGPISTFFLEQQHVLQLRRLSTVSPELPWSNISDWQRSLAALEAEKIHRWIFGGAFVDSDAPRRAMEATADAAATDDATRINRRPSAERIPAANNGDTSDSERSTSDNDDLRALAAGKAAKTATAAGKKRTRQEASKNALDTQRITSLLDDLEAQIAAVTQQYEGPRPAATSSAIHGANAPSATVALEEHDTLAELEALIASVESQYTSRGRRRPTTTASTVAPVRQRRRVAVPTRRDTSTATERDDTLPPSLRLPAVAVAAPARGQSVHHHNRDAPDVSSATASDLTNRSGAMPAPTTAATATATATATAALGGAPTDNDAPAPEASSSTDLAAMLAELEGLTAAVLQHTSVTV
eukprot:gene6801-4904_t